MFSLDIHKISQALLYNPKEPLIFSSGLFLFLFTGFVAVYIALSKTEKPKLIFVTLFSLYFYYKSSGMYFLLLLLATTVDFTLARWIYQSTQSWERKFFLITSLAVNLGVLGYFKYTNFLFGSFSEITGSSFSNFDIFLPVGISFFTFQSLSYTLDVYRRHLKPVNSILDYAFYLSFFPQLVAGPIVRAADFLPQIHKPTVVTNQMLGRGVFLIVCGLFKKAVISDYISLNFVNRVFDAPTLYSGLENLFAVYGYALQIYCDFSGYSDMAIGIALLLGFHFNINFDSPYRSKSITEFWRRWHISLSTWLRDYLYISLGGNRKGKFRTYFNLMITMVLGGLWHGASWRFVIWGGLHGSALAFHKFVSSKYELKARWNFLGMLVTFHFVCFCWIFFRASDIETVGAMLGQIIHHFNGRIFFEFIIGYKMVMIMMLIGYVLHFMSDDLQLKTEERIIQMPLVMKTVCIVVVIVLVIQTKSAGVQPFIYFQF
jgi:D-alanyl-lipoteichoic acid acyltransferase DltB (MBOAT superfamily)